MPLKRAPLPEVGELVVATVQQIFEQGTYVSLDEFQGVRGYVPIVEVASTWVRNVRDYLREKQKVVLKVIRLDRNKGHVDLSLRRVSDLERQTKLMQAKRFQKSFKLLEQIAERTKIPKEQAIDQIGLKLEEKNGELYAALEDVVKFGKKTLEDAGIPEQYRDVVFEVAKEHIHIPEVEVKGIIKVSNMKPNGVKDVRDALLAGRESGGETVKVNIYTVGAPRYRVEVKAYDYKMAEDTLASVANTITEHVKQHEGEAEFKRERA